MQSYGGASGHREFYGVFFEEAEVAALEEAAVAGTDAAQLAASVTAEIELMRIVLRRLMADVEETGDVLTAAPVMFQVARTIAWLMQEKQMMESVAGEVGKGLGFDWGEVRDSMDEKWGVDL